MEGVTVVRQQLIVWHMVKCKVGILMVATAPHVSTFCLHDITACDNIYMVYTEEQPLLERRKEVRGIKHDGLWSVRLRLSYHGVRLVGS